MRYWPSRPVPLHTGSEVLYGVQPSCSRALSRPILTCATPSGAKSGAKAAMP